MQGKPDAGIPLLARGASAGPPPQYTNPGYPAPVSQQPVNGYPQPDAQAQPTYTVPGSAAIGGTRTGVVQTVIVGPSATLLACPFCQHQIRTKTEMRTTKKTYLIALLLCGLGCCCCAWMPFYNDPCRDVDHYCPECDTFLGTYVN